MGCHRNGRGYTALTLRSAAGRLGIEAADEQAKAQQNTGSREETSLAQVSPSTRVGEGNTNEIDQLGSHASRSLKKALNHVYGANYNTPERALPALSSKINGSGLGMKSSMGQEDMARGHRAPKSPNQATPESNGRRCGSLALLFTRPPCSPLFFGPSSFCLSFRIARCYNYAGRRLRTNTNEGRWQAGATNCSRALCRMRGVESRIRIPP